ncbi:MAG: DNA translocase FtsK, partial [Verrucomicrobiota bacterium]
NNIVSTLKTFGVDVEPGDITRGPTITRYELYPMPGLRVNRITSLEADIARATRAERINILAPVPGKDTVGIEIANSDKIPVALRELFEDDAFRNSKAKLPLALGKDVYGRTIVGDLARMPHLLVAGATGSGKSVCINSIIASLLYRFTPDELRFIMVDPKVVEMQLYNELPHMVVPVVTDPKKVLLALRWVINEMERRYALFAQVGTRNFDGYNSMRAKAREEDGLAEEEVEEPELAMAHHVKLSDDLEAEGGFSAEEEPPFDMPAGRQNQPGSGEDLPDSLPYIVVIIDELADLMQTAPADVEMGIARIAQKARAAGIHLIVATQTPRADVVTGIIKANIPSRIAFQVSSKTDSRIILDANGAENLVGKGDMLYLPPGSAQLIRAQGALITDEEAQDLVDACAAQGAPQFEPEAREAIESGGFEEEDEEISDEDEEILEKCLGVIYSEKKASTSLLQRRLRLGYTRAARMIDILESRGIIGPGDGAKPREILVDLSDDFE